MARTNAATRKTKKPAKSTAGLSAEERAAMKERVKELKSTAGESDLLAKIAEMPPADRAIAERLHVLIKETAPALSPRTWYGMPAYANKEGKVVCFFRNAAKFKERYAMFGFNDSANLDEGSMWPVAYALKALTAADEKRIRAVVKKAVS